MRTPVTTLAHRPSAEAILQHQEAFVSSASICVHLRPQFSSPAVAEILAYVYKLMRGR
jgi:hypothetical protein